MKLYRTNGELIADTDHETIKETVFYCIENNISLICANLRGANLSGANLSGADLSGAYLYGADLRDADLRNADLSGADLSGADLRGADLRGADLYRTYLSFAKDIIIFNKFNGRICYAVQHESGLMIQAGCFWGTLEEFEAACIKKYDKNEKENYSKQIAYLKSL